MDKVYIYSNGMIEKRISMNDHDGENEFVESMNI